MTVELEERGSAFRTNNNSAYVKHSEFACRDMTEPPEPYFSRTAFRIRCSVVVDVVQYGSEGVETFAETNCVVSCIHDLC